MVLTALLVSIGFLLCVAISYYAGIEKGKDIMALEVLEKLKDINK